MGPLLEHAAQGGPDRLVRALCLLDEGVQASELIVGVAPFFVHRLMVAFKYGSLSPEEWEQELNERLKELNAKEVAEAAKRAEADRKEFGDCYR